MIDIQKFCADPDDIRYYLHRPARADGGRVAAANGHIAVLVDAGECYDAIESEGTWVKKILEFAQDIPESGFLAARWDFAEDPICTHCDGKPAESDEDGDLIECWWCGGTGLSKKEPVAVGDAHFSKHYLRLIATLPNCEIAARGPSKSAVFKFDGGIGFLMPMREKP